MKSNKSVYAVILAGGMGTRFWPKSRRSNPKQFLNITGRGSLLQETLSRIKPRIRPANTLIVTNAGYRREIKKQVARFRIPNGNILLEPQGKNTAPAICWAAAKIHKMDPGAVMVVLPSDHLITNRRKFTSVLNQAITLAKKDYLVTLGITPTRPETGYGYLQTKKKSVKGKKIFIVEKFKEKPSLALAKKYIRQKRYYWNSGMFIWKSAVILDEFKRSLPAVYQRVGRKTGTVHIKKVWGRLPNISVDYGILEKAKNVAAVPAQGINWSDLGSWESLADVLAADKKNNILKGDVLSVNSRDTLVWGERKLIASVGLDNVVIIDTRDALLVCRKDKSQSVKDIVTMLQNMKRPEI